MASHLGNESHLGKRKGSSLSHEYPNKRQKGVFICGNCSHTNSDNNGDEVCSHCGFNQQKFRKLLYETVKGKCYYFIAFQFFQNFKIDGKNRLARIVQLMTTTKLHDLPELPGLPGNVTEEQYRKILSDYKCCLTQPDSMDDDSTGDTMDAMNE